MSPRPTRPTRPTRSAAALLAGLACLTACAAPSAEAPRTPAYGAAAKSADDSSAPPARAAPAQPAPQAPQAGVAPSAPAPGAPVDPGARRDAFVRASVMLEQAGADCRAACRALGAMDRTAGELCELDGAGPREHACTDAVGRVRAARDRVRAACVACPDGTSLDRDAPVPSPR